MNFYVYALINPKEQNDVFYIGKGTGRRGTQHLNEARLAGRRGADVNIIFEDEIAKTHEISKIEKIQHLQTQDLGAKDLVRVIARGLSESLAFTLESFLIAYAYGRLTNEVSGQHAGRFRQLNDWSDVLFSPAPLLDEYVYVLRDPENGEIFYVGKGTGERYKAHFVAARTANATDQDLGEKLDRLRELLIRHSESMIARVIAQSLTSEEAFAIESLTLKFLVGSMDATNAVSGHHSWRFRAKGDWDLRPGVDLPVSIYDKGDPNIREDEKHVLLGLKLDVLAKRVTRQFPEMTWNGDDPKMYGNNTLAISTKLVKVDESGKPETYRIILIIGLSGLQVECRSSTGIIDEQCKRLGYVNRRKGRLEPFLPDLWWGNPTWDIDDAARRVSQLIGWVSSANRTELENTIGIGECSELLFVDDDLRLDLEVKKYERNKTLDLKNGRPAQEEPACVRSKFYLVGTSFRKKNPDEKDLLGWHFSIERCQGDAGPHEYNTSQVSKLRQLALNSCRRDAYVDLFELSDFDYCDSEMLVETKTLMREKIKKKLKAFLPRLVNAEKTSKFYKLLKNEYPYNWKLSADGFSIFADDVPAIEGDLLFETVGLKIVNYLNQSADTQ
jgi:hypothetical protein